MRALAATGVEAKIYSAMSSSPPWMTANRLPPRVNLNCRGSARIQARASLSSCEAAWANQTSDQSAQALSRLNPQPQSAALKPRDSSQFPITTRMPASRTRSTVATGSPA
jgi:hypothetical protein